MQTVQVRNVTLGEGRPKICVPIVSKTRDEIIKDANKCRELGADVVEWRVDWFEHATDLSAVREVLQSLTDALEGIPLLFTFRTAREGGEKSIDPDTYAGLNKAVIDTGMVDLVDVELFTGDSIVIDLVKDAHKNGVKIISSNHDFDKTPPKEEIIKRLCKMQELGADILKIAVMPTTKEDVLTLLSATSETMEQHTDRPLITMSMGPMGMVSRLSGEIFGSALTFGSAGKSSAPGQIAISELKTVLDIIHSSL